jgi:uncharacterized protein involved in type VI secretion and phage assembly
VNLYRELAQPLARLAGGGRLLAVAPGVVTNNQDPDNLGRVKVSFPWLAEGEESAWARVVTPVAGAQRGLFWLPEVGDEVLLAFEHGDPGRPYVLGGLWNGTDTPPTDAGDGRDVRVLKSRSGHLVRLDDSSGAEKIEIVDKSGSNTIVLDTAANTITLTSGKDIQLKAPQGKILLEAQEVQIGSSAATKVEASGSLTVQASGSLTLKGSTVMIN